MNKLLKATLSILLIVAVCFTGCNKPDDPNNGGNNGNNGGNTPETPAIVSTSEVQYDGIVYIETVFDDETKMYFEIVSPNEVSLVNGEFYYQDNPSLAYMYRGEVVVPESIKHFGLSYSVVSISKKAFYSNDMVTSVYIPNSVVSILSYIDMSYTRGAFRSCTNLNSIRMSNNIIEIGANAFRDCINLTEISLPSSIKQINNLAFFIYNDIHNDINPDTKITCMAINPPILGEAVFYNRNVQEIRVPMSSVESYKTADGWSQYADVIVGI